MVDTMLYYAILYCTVLYCTILYSTKLNCTVQVRVVLALGCSVLLQPITIEETTKTEAAAQEADSECQNSSSGVPLAKEETEEENDP